MDYEKDFEKYIKTHLGYTGLRGDHILDTVKSSISPNILEERTLNVAQMDVFSRLMMDRIIFINGMVNDRMSTTTQAQLKYFASDASSSSKDDVEMLIDTGGGSVKSGLGIVDIMDLVSYDVATTNVGMAASMGAVLLSSGTKGKRSTLVNSRFMVHQVSAGSQGHVKNMIISDNEALKYNFLLLKRLAANSNVSDFNEFVEMHERDVWYDSSDMLKYNFVDTVNIAEGAPTMDDMLVGFDDYRKKMLSI